MFGTPTSYLYLGGVEGWHLQSLILQYIQKYIWMGCFMIQNVITSIILYSGTAVDLLIILMLFFAKRKSRKDIINIYLGQFLGSGSLILLSLLFAFVLNYIPSKEILGLLGLIPILFETKYEKKTKRYYLCYNISGNFFKLSKIKR